MEFWTILGTVILLLFLYYYFFSGENFFDKNGILYRKPVPLLGNMGPMLLRQISVSETIHNAYNLNKDAKYVGFFDFGCPVVMIRDQELAKNLLSPAFTSNKMRGMFKLMSECAVTYADYFAEQSQDKSFEVNTKDAFTRYTNDVIGTCAFGIEINSIRNRNNEFYVLGRKATDLEGILSIKFFVVRSFPKLCKLFNIRIVTKDVDTFFNNLVRDTIAMRDEKGISRPDMIQLMMETRNNKEGPKLTIQDMTSQAFLFFFGGFETSSALMCFMAHEIAARLDIQKKLQEEVDEVFKKHDENPPYEAITSMVYLDAVLNEVLRTYPIVPFIDRVCNSEFELPPALPGKKPVMSKPGDIVWIPVYSFQKDSMYVFDPDIFDPERFIKDGRPSVNSANSLTFGQGPRMCIGNRFALLETKILFVHLLRKFSLEPSERMVSPLQLSKRSLTASAEGGFWVKFQPRKI